MFFDIIRVILQFFYKVFFRIEVSGIDNFPATGPVVIASNHISFWDPPVIGGTLPRLVNFMAKEELFAVPVFGSFLRIFKAFPVKRGTADRTAIRTALNVLAEGEVLGIFPEGTRSKTGELGAPEAGLALIVAKSGAMVIPTLVVGTNKIFSIKHGLFPKLKIKFGKPLYFEKSKTDKQTLDAVSAKIMTEISKLLSDK
jgi:1-acyl-sn-glycerol-3-phosphate acyltransferase